MGTIGFLVVFLVPGALAPECWERDACHYPDTKLLGVPFLDIAKNDISPVTCVNVCSLTDGCVGATLDPLEGICHLYGESVDFELAQEPGVNLWLFQAAGVPCIRVG